MGGEEAAAEGHTGLLMLVEGCLVRQTSGENDAVVITAARCLTELTERAPSAAAARAGDIMVGAVPSPGVCV